MFIYYSSISREIRAKTWDIIENLWFLWKNVFFSEKQKFIIQIKMKSVFEVSELHLKFVYKLKGCSSEYSCSSRTEQRISANKSAICGSIRFVGLPIADIRKEPQMINCNSKLFVFQIFQLKSTLFYLICYSI